MVERYYAKTTTVKPKGRSVDVMLSCGDFQAVRSEDTLCIILNGCVRNRSESALTGRPMDPRCCPISHEDVQLWNGRRWVQSRPMKIEFWVPENK